MAGAIKVLRRFAGRIFWILYLLNLGRLTVGLAGESTSLGRWLPFAALGLVLVLADFVATHRTAGQFQKARESFDPVPIEVRKGITEQHIWQVYALMLTVFAFGMSVLLIGKLYTDSDINWYQSVVLNLGTEILGAGITFMLISLMGERLMHLREQSIRDYYDQELKRRESEQTAELINTILANSKEYQETLSQLAEARLEVRKMEFEYEEQHKKWMQKLAELELIINEERERADQYVADANTQIAESHSQIQEIKSHIPILHDLIKLREKWTTLAKDMESSNLSKGKTQEYIIGSQQALLQAAADLAYVLPEQD